MRRIDLINGVNNLRESFIAANIGRVFMMPDRDIEGILNAFKVFNEYYNTFSDVEKHILRTVGLEILESSEFWAEVINNNSKDIREITHTYWNGIRMVTENLPHIISLLKQDNIEYTGVGNSIKSTSTTDRELLTVILPENTDFVSHPERLIKALDSITLLYQSLGIIYGIEDNSLTVAAIDSGSDKSFDFLGAAKLMTAIKEFILGLWDRVVFFREKKHSEKLDVIAKSLPIIEKISEMINDKTISSEQGEILKRNIITASQNFITVGAVIPEFNKISSFNPRQLMAPEQKLLSSIPHPITENDSTSINESLNDYSYSSDFNDLSQQEVDELRALLNKKKPKK